MRFESYRMEFSATPGQAGSAVACEDLINKQVQVWGTFTATFDLQGRCSSDAAWQNIASITGPGLTSVPGTFQALRLSTSAYTSPPTGVVLAGTNSRVD